MLSDRAHTLLCLGLIVAGWGLAVIIATQGA